MNNNNFGKDIRNMNENELFFHINNHDPKFGSVCQYELMRRLAIRNEESSKKYNLGSAYLSITALLVSLGIGAVQIYISVIMK